MNGRKVSLSYVKGTMEKLAKMFRRKGIKVAFAPPNIIGNMVDSTKDPVKLGSCQGGFSIPCSCGKVYIDKTYRSMELRFKEHSADLSHYGFKKSSLVEHSHKTSPQIYLENIKTLQN